MVGPAHVDQDLLRRELVRLLRVAFPLLTELQAFVAEHWPSVVAVWHVSPGAQPRPSGRSAASDDVATLIKGLVIEPLMGEGPQGVARLDLLGRPSMDARARSLAEFVVDESLRTHAVHRLLDGVGNARPYLIDEVVAVRALLSSHQRPRQRAPFPLSAWPSARPKRSSGPPVGFGGEGGSKHRADGLEGLDRPGHAGAASHAHGAPEAKGADGPAGTDERPRELDWTGAPGAPGAPKHTKAGWSSAAPPLLSIPVAIPGLDALVDPLVGPLVDPLVSPDPRPAAHAKPVRPQIVSLGFCNRQAPDALILDRTLAVEEDYLFWLEIKPEYAPRSLPGAEPLVGLREGDVIDVILFGFPDQLALEGPRHGRLRMDQDAGHVVQRAFVPARDAGSPFTLYFAVRTPPAPGRHSLRCNLYCRGLLLQSHLITAEVTATVREQRHALRRVVDYNLTATLDTARLGADSECTFSLFLNDDGHGTHSFRFVSSVAGVPEQIADGHIEAERLQNAIGYARGALRFAAWGSVKPWIKDTPYLLDPGTAAHLLDSWILLARRGASLWMEISKVFEWLGPEALALREKLRTPGRLQVALKDSPDSVLPAALIYDYPLDVGRRQLTVCSAALDAIGAQRQLDTEPCFVGQCPHYAKDDVVCPGGFWGFRHELGLPIHLPKGEVAATIPRGDSVRAFAAISLDPAFVRRDAHLAALEQLLPGAMEVLRDRDACLARLDDSRQLVYFYCHGGLLPETDTPYLLVGPNDSDPLLAQSLFNSKVWWESPLRPLVILNGCHTTATSPDEMFSLLSAFAAQCNAAGVIGTEITNFEPVAVAFGQELVQRFLGGETVGRAVLQARLALLRKGNPLGLMYIPFALPSLRLA